MNTNSKKNGTEQCTIPFVVCYSKCGDKLTNEMLQEQKDEIEMGLDVLCKNHWKDDRLYMSDLVMY